MTDQHHLLRAIRDIGRTVERTDPQIVGAALGHLLAGLIAREGRDEEFLNPRLVRSNFLSDAR